MQHFTSIHDVEDPALLVKEAISLKEDPFQFAELGKNKILGLIFFNSSLRTRMSTQVAASRLGMQVITMNVSQDSWQLEFDDGTTMNGSKAEHIREAAAVMGQYCDILGVRAFPGLQNREKDYSEFMIKAFQTYSGVPVLSLESATLHPLQSFADWITIEEHSPRPRPKVVLSWAPHPKALPQAVANSFAEWMMKAPVDLTITQPEGYELADTFTANANVLHHQEDAFKDADFIYVKSWSSFSHYGQHLNVTKDWMINEEKMALTNDAKLMHCLPVRRNVVIQDTVLDSPQSLVIPQANNRIFSAQIVLKHLINDNL